MLGKKKKRRAEDKEAKTVKRITRNRRLTPEEAAKYQAIREQVAGELPELIARMNRDYLVATITKKEEKMMGGTG